MNTPNLALVFGPTLTRAPADADPRVLHNDVPAINVLIQLCIDQYDYIFGDESEDEGLSSPPPPPLPIMETSFLGSSPNDVSYNYEGPSPPPPPPEEESEEPVGQYEEDEEVCELPVVEPDDTEEVPPVTEPHPPETEPCLPETEPHPPEIEPHPPVTEPYPPVTASDSIIPSPTEPVNVSIAELTSGPLSPVAPPVVPGTVPVAPPVVPGTVPVAPPVIPGTIPVAPPVVPGTVPVAPPVVPGTVPVAPPVIPGTIPVAPPVVPVAPTSDDTKASETEEKRVETEPPPPRSEGLSTQISSVSVTGDIKFLDEALQDIETSIEQLKDSRGGTPVIIKDDDDDDESEDSDTEGMFMLLVLYNLVCLSVCVHVWLVT